MLWLARSTSWLGSEVTQIALPLAGLVLGAGPVHMGLLRATGSAANLLAGPVAGVLVDRVRRRPLLIAADLARAVVLALVPLGAVGGWLTIEVLLAVALAAGLLGTVGSVAGGAFLVAVVPRERLVDANGLLAASRQTVQVVGPGLGGLIVAALTAPVAVALDALSFVASALLQAGLRGDEPAPVRRHGERLLDEASAGVRFLLGEPTLRRLVAAIGLFELCDSALFGLYVLFVSEELGVDPAALGLIFAVGGAGGVLGALLAGPTAARLGQRRALVLGVLVAGVGDALVPWAAALPRLTVPALATAELLVALGVLLFGVNHDVLLQRLTPDDRLGRVGAAVRMLVGGCGTVGALAGGAAAAIVGVRPVLFVAASLTLTVGLWLAWSSLWRLDPLELTTVVRRRPDA